MRTRRQCFTNFPEAEYRFRKIRETPREVRSSQGEERARLWKRLFFLVELLPEGVRELWVPVLRQPEFPQHFH